jgi:hypothetical protein
MGLQCEWRPNWVFTCRLKCALQYDTKHGLFLSSFKYEGLIEWRSKWSLQGLNECRSNWSFTWPSVLYKVLFERKSNWSFIRRSGVNTRVDWVEIKLVFYHTKCSKYKVWLSGDESALLSHKLVFYNIHWVSLSSPITKEGDNWLRIMWEWKT